jgi:plastocyanin
MKNVLIVLVIVLLVGGGGYIAWTMMDSDKNDNSQVSTSETNDQDADDETGEITEEATATNEVSYDSDGFSPEGITVEAGTKVTWTNNSGSDMWVASNPHPVHTDFSSFDQKKAGDSYSFTFDKAGTYDYHNHLNSSDTGSVVVK